MGYVTGDIPVGSYDPNRLANLGMGHGAIDAGGAYTYLNSMTGWEVSATAGLTYNFENADTDYTNGIDSHVDVGILRLVNEQFFAGIAGYAYVQLTHDKGQLPVLRASRAAPSASAPSWSTTSPLTACRSTPTCAVTLSSTPAPGPRAAACSWSSPSR